MSVLGSPTRRACNACPGVAFYYHKAHEITNSDSEPLIRVLTGAGLLTNPTGSSLVKRIREKLQAYITARLGKYIGAAFRGLISNLQDSILNVSNFLTFDATFRVYTHAQGAPIEYIRCTENGARRTKATRGVVDTWDSTRNTWVEHFSDPLVELDHNTNYILLDERDKACMFYEKPGAELISKITKHEAESFMSKHGLKADMAAMEADMRKDYGDLMHTVTSEAKALGLSIRL